jgi:hypothetical protein
MQQRETGIKDPIAYPILQRLQAYGTMLLTPNSEGVAYPREQAWKMVREDFEHNPPSLRMNPLLCMRGTVPCFYVGPEIHLNSFQ